MTIDELKVIITAKVDGLKTGVQEAKKQIESLRSASERATKSFDNTDLAGLKAQLKDANVEIQKQKAQLGEITSELRRATEEAARLAKEFKDTYGIIDSVEGLPENGFTRGFNSAKAGVDAAKAAAAELTRQQEAYNDKIEETKQKIAGLKVKIEEAKNSAKTSNKVVSGVGKQINGVVSIFKRTIIRKAIQALLKDFSECYELLMKFDSGLGNTLGYNKQMSDVTSQIKQVSANIAVIVAELLNIAGPVLTKLLQGLNSVLTIVSKIMAVLQGNSTYTIANPDYWTDYAKSLDTAAESQKKLIGGFDELNTYSSTSTSSSTDTNPNDLYKTVELEGAWKKASEIFAKIKDTFQNLFGDEWGSALFSLGELVTALGLAKIAVDLLKKAFNKKNKSLETQNALEGEAATQLESSLVPALSTAALGVAALGLALKNLPESMPVLEPQVSTAPAYSAIENIKSAFSKVKLPSLVPTVALTGVSTAIANIKEWFSNVSLPSLSPSFSLTPVNEVIATIKEKFSSITLPTITPSVNTSSVKQSLSDLTSSINTFTENTKSKFATFASEFNSKVANTISSFKTNTAATISSLSTSISTTFNNIKNNVTTWCSTTLTSIKTWGSNVSSSVSASLTTTKATVTTWASTTLANIKSWATNVNSNISSAFTNAKSNISSWVSTTAGNIRSWASNTAGNIKNAVTNIANNVYSGFTNAGKNIGSWVSTTSSNIAKWASNAAKNVASFCSNMVSNIKSAVKTGLSWLSKVFTGVSSWASANSAAITAGLVAAGVAAVGIALAPYTAGASLSLMALANGGVAKSPTAALIGEYPGAQSNPEIVTPQSILMESLEANNSTLISAWTQMTRQVITAISNVDMSVSIGDDVIAKSAARGNNAYKRMTGTALI